MWKTLKDILSPKSTFDPDTHYNNLISSEPYRNDIQKKDNILGIIRDTLSPKSTDDPETHFGNLISSQLDDKIPKKFNVWDSVKDLISPKSTHDPETHFENSIRSKLKYILSSPDSLTYDEFQTNFDKNLNTQHIGVKQDQDNLWTKIKSLISPKSTFDPETHFSNIISSNSENNQDTIERVWNGIKEIISPKATQDPEIHLTNAISHIRNGTYNQRENVWSKLSYALFSSNTPKQDQFQTNFDKNLDTYDYGESPPAEYYGQLKEGLLEKLSNTLITSDIKEIIEPIKTLNPKEHFSNIISHPIVETVLNKASQVSREDILKSAVIWWHLIYKLVFAAVFVVVGGAFFADANTAGGLV